jgi:hypothetical protein
MQHEKALELAAAAPTWGRSAAFGGSWCNQMGSTMDLVVRGTAVTGSYESLSRSEAPPVVGEVIGYTIGDLISFMVLWEGSITAWVGQMIDEDTETPKIRTLWHMVTEVPDADEPKYLWVSTYSGADEFERLPPWDTLDSEGRPTGGEAPE